MTSRNMKRCSSSLPVGASGEESSCQCRRCKNAGSIPRLGRSPGGGNGNPVQYSCLKNPMDRGTWWAAAGPQSTALRTVGHDWSNLVHIITSRKTQDHDEISWLWRFIVWQDVTIEGKWVNRISIVFLQLHVNPQVSWNIGVGWGGRWEGGSRGRGYLYTYGWLMLRFGRKQQNSAKAIILQLKNKKKKE